MKKYKLWAKFKIQEELESWQNIEGGIDEDGIKYVLNIIDQVDEPEVLSEEWIEENKKDSGVHYIGYYVPIGRLHDLLVPKRGEVLSEKWIDEHSNGASRSQYVWVDDLKELLVPKQEVTEEQVMHWIDNNEFYDHATAETVLANAVDKGELGYYGTKYSLVEKPVIPKFVAEWYEREGKKSSWWSWFYKWGRGDHRTVLEVRTIRWMEDFNEELFVDMFRYGYEVEEEQKYNVQLKVRSSSGVVGVFLYKQGDEILAGDNFKVYYPEEDRFRLTEQEIKSYDEKFWPFAVKVEELTD